MEEVVGPGHRVTGVRWLGGTWLANHAVRVRSPSGTVLRLVLRRWARPGWDVDDPDFSAHREAAVLGLLSGSGVPAPGLVAADPEARRCDVPALLVTRVPGHPPGPRETADLPAFLAQLAGALAAVHRVDGWDLPAYRRYYEVDQLRPPSPVWARAAALVAEPPPPGRTAFIHRDYHPGNTLWSRGRLTGVVDWTTGSRGPLAVDLGHMRWNLALDHGLEAANAFLEAYRSLAGESCEDQPYWDLVTALDVMADVDPGELRPLEAYVASLSAPSPGSPGTAR